RTKVAEAEVAGQPMSAVDGDTARHHALHGSGNCVAGGIEVGEARAGNRNIAVEDQPRLRAEVVRPLDAVPAARPSGFGRTRVAGEYQLRLKVQRPEGKARLQVRDGDRTNGDLGPLSPHERREPVA